MTEVIIIGAGPTGLMAAALLHHHGVAVRVFSKAEGPARESRAFGIHARSLELFLNLGLVEEFLNRGLLATGVQVFLDGQCSAELNFDDIGRSDTPYGFVLMVPQWDVEDILLSHLQRSGVKVEYGVEAFDLDQSDNMVLVRVRHPGQDRSEEIQAPYAIGADGAHSLVRRKLGLHFEGEAYPQGFLLADCHLDWALDHSHIKIFLRGNRFAAFLPLKGTQMGRVMVLAPTQPGQGEGCHPASLEEVEKELREASGHKLSLSDALWTSRYHIHHRGVRHYRQGRVFLAGDSAHIHSPVGAQGMNTGLQDAANLAWKLTLALRGDLPANLLDTYHQERWPVGQKIIKFTDRIFSLIISQKTWLSGLRNRLLPRFAGTVSRTGVLRGKAFHFVSQLGIRYHGLGFLRDDGPFKAVLKAGERAPNAGIARGVDVFSLIQGYRFHVLALSSRPLDEPEIARLASEMDQLPVPAGIGLGRHIVCHSLIGRDPRIHRCECSQIFQAYGLDDENPQALFLIRPDGYIAYRSLQLHLSGLRRFLTDRMGAK